MALTELDGLDQKLNAADYVHLVDELSVLRIKCERF